MTDYFASVDTGNGMTNVLVFDAQRGTFKSLHIPSVRSVASKTTLGLKGELDKQWIDWYGMTYYAGEDCLIGTRTAIEKHMGAGRYGEEFSRFMAAVGIARAGVKSGAVDLTLFAPPGLYLEARRAIQANFSGNVKITLKGDKKPREWRYENVTVWPEGIGAVFAFIYDDAGKLYESDILSGDVVVLDIGVFTLDALRLVGGRFDVDSLEQATWEGAGINTHVWQPALKFLRKQDDDFSILTEDDIDMTLRRGFANKDWRVTVAGKEANMKDWFHARFDKYADWIANNICDGVFNGFRGIKSVILVGGGAAMVTAKLRDLYPDKIVNMSAYPHLKKLHPGDLNAVGGLRYALAGYRK